jgi:hypothetical protein
MRRLRFAVLGAALAYFFDPANGTRRRKAAIKRLASLRSRGGSRLTSGPAPAGATPPRAEGVEEVEGLLHEAGEPALRE